MSLQWKMHQIQVSLGSYTAQREEGKWTLGSTPTFWPQAMPLPYWSLSEKGITFMQFRQGFSYLSWHILFEVALFS